MDVTILVTELTALAQEAKRKHPDIKKSADAALQELKSLPASAGPRDYLQCPSLVTPFVLGCQSGNAKLAKPASVGIQRIAVVNGFAPEQIAAVTDGLCRCAEAVSTMEVQLKILQTLPVLAQNYARAVRGPSLGNVFGAASVLLGSKTAAVASTATATMQQLVSLVYEHLKTEEPDDEKVEVALGEETVLKISPAAHAAYTVFFDMCCVGTQEGPKFMKLAPFPPSTFFSVMESILNNQGDALENRAEQAFVLRTALVPLVAASLSQTVQFSIAVHHFRLLRIILGRYLALAIDDCETALSLMNHFIDSEPTNSWRRVLAMELFSGLYSDIGTLINIFSHYDMVKGRKPIMLDNLGLLVRVASEQPSLIGLASSPSCAAEEPPVAEIAQTVAAAEADPSGGGAHIFDTGTVGISHLWSVMRVPCLELLARPNSAAIPNTYIYTLILSSLGFLSDGLASVTMPSRKRKKGDDLVKQFLNQAWPAVLAVTSTLLYSTLDNDYFRQLARAVQKITQACGLLSMTAPRDAFLSFLGKTAIPANTIPALRSLHTQTTTDNATSNSSARTLLAVGNMVSNTVRRPSTELSLDQLRLSVWNLVCMRALVNLAVSLGPTLGSGWVIVMESIQHIDLLTFPSTKPAGGQIATPYDRLVADINLELFNLGQTLKKLNVVTADFGNSSFRDVLSALRGLLSRHPTLGPKENAESDERRKSTISNYNEQEYVSSLRRLRSICMVNLSRFAKEEPGESGWEGMTAHLELLFADRELGREVRATAADVIIRSCSEMLGQVELEAGERAAVNRLAVGSLVKRYLDPLPLPLDGVETATLTSVFSTLHSIVERTGDSLGEVWNPIFSTLNASFMEREPAEYDAKLEAGIEIVAITITRSAFNVVELICSDYLGALPQRCLAVLTNLLFRFSAQKNDLNMSLTASANYWNLSDYLLRTFEDAKLDEMAAKVERLSAADISSSFEDEALVAPYIWAKSLARLTVLVQDPRAEVRDGALRILLRIFEHSGPRLSPAGWEFFERLVILPLAAENLAAYRREDERPFAAPESESTAELVETSRMIIGGVSDLAASNVDPIVAAPGFSAFWQRLLEVLSSFLGLQSFAISSRVYSSLADLLDALGKKKVGLDEIVKVKTIWIENFPYQSWDIQFESNQAAFTSYVQTFTALYRHCTNLEAGEIEVMLSNLLQTVACSDDRLHSRDRDEPTVLQALVLEAIQMVQVEQEAIRALIIRLLAKAIRLPLIPSPSGARLSFVAFSRGSIGYFEAVCLAGLAGSDHLIKSGVLASALAALRDIIATKAATDGPAAARPAKGELWLAASATAVRVIEAAVDQAVLTEPAGPADGAADTIADTWHAVVGLVDAIATGDTAAAAAHKLEHEDVDVGHLRTLFPLLRPRLTAGAVPAPVRHRFAASLLHNSLLHPAADGPLLVVGARGGAGADRSSPREAPLTVEAVPEVLASGRAGRLGATADVAVTARRAVAGACLRELFAVIEADTWAASAAAGRTQGRTLAAVVLPYTVVRAALPLLAYAADQPLRGSLPQPESVREELGSVVQSLLSTKCVLGLRGGTGEEEEGVEDTHLSLLYPVICDAVKVARLDPDGTVANGLVACLARLKM